jgi:hypothetical protein
VQYAEELKQIGPLLKLAFSVFPESTDSVEYFATYNTNRIYKEWLSIQPSIAHGLETWEGIRPMLDAMRHYINRYEVVRPTRVNGIHAAQLTCCGM